MKFWVVCWVGDGNVPCVDVFAEKENALACVNYMLEQGKIATIRPVNVQFGENPEAQEENPVESTEVSEED